MPSLNGSENSCVKKVQNEIEAVFMGIRRDVQLGHFIILNVPFSIRIPRLTSLNSFSFRIRLLKFVWTFCSQQSISIEKLPSPGSRVLLPFKQQLTKCLPSNFQPSTLPRSLCGFYRVSGLCYFDWWENYFRVMSCKSFALISI